ncbi:uncharacterized protein LOC111798828 [Cucurbita pepo subsp. pepo]|uniref:uncharacterized protein LOC111798828 n=1 Tax=Cucurbita pepo subsp. pepo TaxID=3664 RepID=UPI000C9D42BE|nr:uncharacterized protein LOC111798828 [Cucurbita pepo subsp. pepo]
MAIPLMEEVTIEETILDEIKEVLNSYADIMPEGLPQTLPPRRGIDHEIELLPGVKPPAKNAYRMAPTELAELRKQLDELLTAGFIRPTKAPYGAPVFYEYLDQFVIVYLDDIDEYSTTLEEHKVHLKLVSDKLQQNQLYVKKEKYAFAQTCINFLGHVISYG